MDNVSAATSPFYVVRGGREGSRIYHTWEEVGNNVLDQPNASVHVFPSLTIAEEWLRNQEMSSLQGLGSLHLFFNVNKCSNEYCFFQRENQVKPAPLPSPSRQRIFLGTSSDSDDSDDADEEQSLPLPSLEVLSQPGANPVLLDSEAEEPQIQLSHEQRRVLDIAKSGRSIFFTGAAGTGKSVLLREIIRWGRSHYGTDHVAVTAPTGIAANNIGGGTIYSWAGIELGKEAPYVHMAIIRNKSIVVDDDGKKFLIPGSPLDRWKKCQMLVLDEVSMIDGRLIDKLEWLGRHIKRDDAKMWGGIQLIICGDFYQLPPISQKAENRKIYATFAFEASSWHYTVGDPIVLTKVFRQKDVEFIEMLNAMRVDKMSPTHIAKFMELHRPVICPDGIKPTLLFPKREQVLNANMKELAELPGEEHKYIAKDSPGIDEITKEPFPPEIVKSALGDMVALEKVSLKEGAQVMLIKNLVAGSLINGSLGKVIGFVKALEAHNKRIDFGLPQCLNERYDPVAKTTKRQDPPSWLMGSERQWPLVEFTRSKRQILCVPMAFEASNAYGVVEATREQIPLILAWAMSIDKSQGQTIDYVSVDVKHCFENGQVYAAMSRATSREGLQVIGFDPLKVRADDRVKKYMGTHLHQSSADEDDVDRILDFWDITMNS